LRRAFAAQDENNELTDTKKTGQRSRITVLTSGAQAENKYNAAHGAWPFLLGMTYYCHPARRDHMKRGIIVIFLFALVSAYAQSPQGRSFRPKEGFVPNAETAVKVGEAVLMPVYGEKQINGERPFKATLRGSVWTVEGTLSCGNCIGGTAVVKISKTSGQILFMTHYQ
jgi:hypothetical protein